jgi:NAD(P)-dependent dehydrogenase (short-subunit alcohol dehydrogenase family)
MISMNGKVVIVTGSTRGIGLATARLIARAGGSVVISSRKAQACEEVCQTLRAEGLEVMPFAAHAAQEEDIRRLVDATLQRYGHLDAVVANAGINPVFDPVTEISDSSWSRILDTNVAGPLRLARHALPHIATSGGGSMVMISSVNAHVGFAGSGAYGVSKAALEQLTRQLAVEWGPRRITVNAVCPGTVRTDMIRLLLERPGFLDGVQRASPLGRIAEPDDVAGAVLFLLSDLARYVTGHVLAVDGGQTITRRA